MSSSRVSGPVSGHVFIATSLDGYIARSDGSIDWLESVSMAGEDYGYGAFLAGMDAIVMGRGTFATVAGFAEWPYQLPVMLLSRSTSAAQLPQPVADRLHLVRDVRQALALAGSRGWRRLYVDGGATIRSWLAENTIAELVINRLPLLLGEGRPLFGAPAPPLALRHVETRSFASGLVQSRYVMATDQARPE